MARRAIRPEYAAVVALRADCRVELATLALAEPDPVDVVRGGAYGPGRFHVELRGGGWMLSRTEVIVEEATAPPVADTTPAPTPAPAAAPAAVTDPLHDVSAATAETFRRYAQHRVEQDTPEPPDPDFAPRARDSEPASAPIAPPPAAPAEPVLRAPDRATPDLRVRMRQPVDVRDLAATAKYSHGELYEAASLYVATLWRHVDARAHGSDAIRSELALAKGMLAAIVAGLPPDEQQAYIDAPPAPTNLSASAARGDGAAPRANGVYLGPAEPRYPRLRAHLAGHPLVVFGGRKLADAVAWAGVQVGIEPEWIATERDDGTIVTARLAERILRRNVGALVLVNGFLGHKFSRRVVDAARRAKMPHVYAGKGSSSELEIALNLLERMVSGRKEAS